MTSWPSYLRTIAQGNGLPASSARLCIRIGGARPCDARQRLKDRLAAESITAEEYITYSDAVDDIAEMFNRGTFTHQENLPKGDWISVGEGCHKRREHIKGDGK